MINQPDIGQILFLDIETASARQGYEELDETWRELWKIKCRSILRDYDNDVSDEQALELYGTRAGIFAEFGKIICISVGFIFRNQQTKRLGVRLTSFASENEEELLREFAKMIGQHFNDPNQHFLCGHNIREFDIPYICRRMVVNALPFPRVLDIAGKKPWETKHLIDTLELWKFGDRKNYTSLKLLAAVLGFPSPKDDIDGADVGKIFWTDKDLERISAYCEKDVLATVQLYLRYRLMPLIDEEEVVHVAPPEPSLSDGK